MDLGFTKNTLLEISFPVDAQALCRKLQEECGQNYTCTQAWDTFQLIPKLAPKSTRDRYWPAILGTTLQQGDRRILHVILRPVEDIMTVNAISFTFAAFFCVLLIIVAIADGLHILWSASLPALMAIFAHSAFTRYFSSCSKEVILLLLRNIK